MLEVHSRFFWRSETAHFNVIMAIRKLYLSIFMQSGYCADILSFIANPHTFPSIQTTHPARYDVEADGKWYPRGWPDTLGCFSHVLKSKGVQGNAVSFWYHWNGYKLPAEVSLIPWDCFRERPCKRVDSCVEEFGRDEKRLCFKNQGRCSLLQSHAKQVQRSWRNASGKRIFLYPIMDEVPRVEVPLRMERCRCLGVWCRNEDENHLARHWQMPGGSWHHPSLFYPRGRLIRNQTLL